MSIVYISRTAVSKLKKEAKRLQRQTGRPHHEILDELAKGVGFANWHHVTLADTESQQLHAKYKSGLFGLWDIKESLDVGDFTPAPVGVAAMLEAQSIEWLRQVHEDNHDGTDEDLREHLNENFVLLQYTGSDPLPSASMVMRWTEKHCFWPPAIVWLRGQKIDPLKRTPADSRDDDNEDEPEVDEPMPQVDEAELNAIFKPRPGTKLVTGRPELMDRTRIFAGGKSAWHWCLHCERAYPNGSFRQQGEYQMCPYEGCSGDTVTDLWRWGVVRDGNPGYPEIPELGRHYPLYPPKR